MTFYRLGFAIFPMSFPSPFSFAAPRCRFLRADFRRRCRPESAVAAGKTRVPASSYQRYLKTLLTPPDRGFYPTKI